MTLDHGTPSGIGLRSGFTLAALLVLALVCLAAPSRAQPQPPSSGALLNQAAQSAPAAAAVLISMSVAADAPGQEHVVLTFAPRAPAFSIVKAEGDHLVVAFAATTRGTARAPAAGKLFRTADFDQQGDVLFLRLATASPASLTATAAGDRVISLTLKAEQGDTTTAAAGAGLPKAEDRPPGLDSFEVVPLKYADVSEVVGLLTEGLTVKSNDVFVPIEPAFGSPGATGGPNGPPQNGQAPQDQPLAQSVDAAISIDRRLNAIILKGSPAAIARLKEKIAQIDVPVQSVILETMFVELDENGATNVGLNFNNANSQIGVATFQSGAFASGGGNSERILSSVSLQAAISAQVLKGHGRIVSKPRIAAQSGSTAKIITGDALPILTSIALSGVNAVSQQVQYVNVGVTLQIAPRISNNGYVTSHVFCVVSSVTGTSQGYPTISQREAETSATVRDGETFVIGGLTVDSELSTDSKVPGLGDIPGLGQLFHFRQGTRSKTDLYIVVTPRIIKRDDIAVVSAGTVTAQLSQAPAQPLAPPPAMEAQAMGASDASSPAVAPQTVAAPPLAAPVSPAPEALTAPAEPASATIPAPSPRTDIALRGTSPADSAVERISRPRGDGAAMVQIGAFASAGLAQKAAKETEDMLTGQMADKTLVVEAVAKDGKRFYRASIAGFTSSEDAATFCSALKAMNRPCFVSRGHERHARPDG